MASEIFGIIGGMARAVTADFYRRVVVATGASVDQCHVRVPIDAGRTFQIDWRT